MFLKYLCMCVVVLGLFLAMASQVQARVDPGIADPAGSLGNPYWIEYGLFDREPNLPYWDVVTNSIPYGMVLPTLSNKKVGDYVLLSNRFESAPAGSMVADEYMINQIDPVHMTVSFTLVQRNFLTYDAQSKIVCADSNSCVLL